MRPYEFLDDLTLGDGIKRHDHIGRALVGTCVEDLEWIVRVEGLLEEDVFDRDVICQKTGHNVHTYVQ